MEISCHRIDSHRYTRLASVWDGRRNDIHRAEGMISFRSWNGLLLNPYTRKKNREFVFKARTHTRTHRHICNYRSSLRFLSPALSADSVTRDRGEIKTPLHKIFRRPLHTSLLLFTRAFCCTYKNLRVKALPLYKNDHFIM